MRRILHVLVAALTLAVLAVETPVASAAERGCATTSTLKKTRRLLNDHHLKMKFCLDGSSVTLEALGKGISASLDFIDSVRVDLRVRDSKRKVLHTESRTFGDISNGLTGGWGGWNSSVIGGFELPQVYTGRHTVEIRLLVDWAGDGRGYQTTGFKALRVRG